MKKILLLVSLLSLYGCSVLHAQHKGEKKPTHYLMAMYGKNQLYFDSIRSHKTISVGYNPLPLTKGFGLNAWYLREDMTSYYGGKPSMIIIQPSVHLLHKSLVVKLCMNIIYKSEGEEPGLKGWLPAIEINYGFMKNFYLSAGYRYDMFFGRLTANLHYVFSDNISEIMIGYTNKENWDDEYNGLTYKLDCMIFNKLLLRVCGNVDYKFSSQGIQAGIGMLI